MGGLCTSQAPEREDNNNNPQDWQQVGTKADALKQKRKIKAAKPKDKGNQGGSRAGKHGPIQAANS
eukprot:7096900-Prorocentrum_lima.AAC.1